MIGFLVAAPSAAEIPQPGSAIRAVLRSGWTTSLIAGCCAIVLGGLGRQAMSGDLLEEVSTDERLALFSNAVEQVGLSERLKDAGPLTLFVPSDQAMINEGSAFLLEGVLLTKSAAEQLADLVLHQIVPARRLTPDQLDGVDLPTLSGVPLRVDRPGKALLVGGWAVVTDRKEADNGIIYVIDRLLWPRDWRPDPDVAELVVKVHNPAKRAGMVPQELELKLGKSYRLLIENISHDTLYVRAPYFANDTFQTRLISMEAGDVGEKASAPPVKSNMPPGLRIPPGTLAKWEFSPVRAGRYRLECGTRGKGGPLADLVVK